MIKYVLLILLFRIINSPLVFSRNYYVNELIPVDLDLDDPNEERIRESLVRHHPLSYNYVIKDEDVRTHKIGTVRKGDIIIYEDSQILIHREVLVVDDNGLYVMITSRYHVGEAMVTRETMEFVMRENSEVFVELIKDIVHLNVKDPLHIDERIKTNMIEGVRTYYISDFVLANFLIGNVFYGNQLLNGEIIDVLSKVVKIEEDDELVHVLISISYRDGIARGYYYDCHKLEQELALIAEPLCTLVHLLEELIY